MTVIYYKFVCGRVRRIDGRETNSKNTHDNSNKSENVNNSKKHSYHTVRVHVCTYIVGRVFDFISCEKLSKILSIRLNSIYHESSCCIGMLCYVMYMYFMLCYDMLCYVMLCYIMLYDILSYCVMLCSVLLCLIISFSMLVKS